jgi:hypothetical protein
MPPIFPDNCCVALSLETRREKKVLRDLQSFVIDNAYMVANSTISKNDVKASLNPSLVLSFLGTGLPG